MNTNVIPKIFASNSYPFRSGYKTTKITETKNGYLIRRFSNYISLQYIKVVYSANGFSKATVKVDKNYHAKYQFTIYFDAMGNEINSELNTTISNKKAWLLLQK